MRRVVLAVLIPCLAVGTPASQSCDSQAVSANGKPLHGAAKMSFVKKCKRDACGSKAVSAEGKPLHRAAKNSFMTRWHEGSLERWRVQGRAGYCRARAQLGSLDAPKSDGNGGFTPSF